MRGAWVAVKRLSHINYISGTLHCFPHTENVHKAQEENQCSAVDGQCDINRLRQQDGRHPLHCPLGSSSDHLGIVPGYRNHNSCRVLTQFTECARGVGVMP